MKIIILLALLPMVFEFALASPHYMEESWQGLEILEKGSAEEQYQRGKGWLDVRGEVINSDELAFKQFEKAAAKGHVPAQYEFGLCYLRLRNMEKDEVKAIEWITKAAEQKYAPALFMLGQMSWGIDDKKAFEWYTKSAEQGYAQGMYQLWMCYGLGRGVEKDEEKSFEWLKKAAEQGYADAQQILGSFYERGAGVAKDMEEAIKWYDKSAEQMGAWKQYEYGVRFLNGDENMPKDAERYVKWLSKAADQEFVKAQYDLVAYYVFTGGNDELAKTVERIRKLAEQDTWMSPRLSPDEIKEALFNMGQYYEKGIGVPKDLDEAIKWYKKAEKYNDERARERLKEISNKDGTE